MLFWEITNIIGEINNINNIIVQFQHGLISNYTLQDSNTSLIKQHFKLTYLQPKSKQTQNTTQLSSSVETVFGLSTELVKSAREGKE